MKLIKHKVRHIDEGDLIPDVFEGRSYSHDTINSAEYLGSTLDDHEVLRIGSGRIIVIHSIDLDWYEE